MKRPCESGKHKFCVERATTHKKAWICPHILILNPHFPLSLKCVYPEYGTYFTNKENQSK